MSRTIKYVDPHQNVFWFEEEPLPLEIFTTITEQSLQYVRVGKLTFMIGKLAIRSV